MISIKKEAIKAERKAFDSALAALEGSLKQVDEILGKAAAAAGREKELIVKLEALNEKRKQALLESGGEVSDAVIDLREQRKECELEIKDLADVQATLKAIADDKKPGLYQLAADAFKARSYIGHKAVDGLSTRKAELINELGVITALELVVEKLGTPFDAQVYWRFGDGTPFDELDAKVGRIASAIKHTAESNEGAHQLLKEIGIKDVPTGPLKRESIGSPLAARNRQA